MGFSRQEYESGQPFLSPGDLPDSGIKPESPALQADSLPSKPPGKPKNTGVGSLSLVQEIFLTQGSNWGLLHCRWILYQLSYQGSLSINLLTFSSLPLTPSLLISDALWFEKKKKCVQPIPQRRLSRVRLFATPWTVAYQAPLSMGFSKQQYWSGLPFPSPVSNSHLLKISQNTHCSIKTMVTQFSKVKL